jgi:two-component system, OmpR family, response regulator
MRLLVVEDESRLALLLKRGLEEQGYVVDVTGDGEEALWLATETSCWAGSAGRWRASGA